MFANRSLFCSKIQNVFHHIVESQSKFHYPAMNVFLSYGEKYSVNVGVGILSGGTVHAGT